MIPIDLYRVNKVKNLQVFVVVDHYFMGLIGSFYCLIYCLAYKNMGYYLILSNNCIYNMVCIIIIFIIKNCSFLDVFIEVYNTENKVKKSSNRFLES